MWRASGDVQVIFGVDLSGCFLKYMKEGINVIDVKNCNIIATWVRFFAPKH